MKKAIIGMTLILMLAALAGCGDSSDKDSSPSVAPPASTAPSTAPSTEPTASPSGPKTIKYLDVEYEIPANAERIVITGAMEAMEDSILMDVHPVGAIAVSGKFPALFSSITDKAESIGEKTAPNFEKILSLKPDVILSSSKFAPEVMEQLQKIATTIPYSHISTNWEANLTLLGELTGKEDKAKETVNQYNKDLATVKAAAQEKLKDKKVLLLRIRVGQIFIYSASTYFNPMLYGDLGLDVPAEVTAAEAQEAVSIEKFAEINPDVLFLQFSEDENAEAKGALEDLQKNPIFQSVNAVKNGQLFINAVDPLAQGGTAYSKVEFLKAFKEKLGL